MTPLQIFNNCNTGKWNTAGNDVQFKVENRTLYFQCSKGSIDWKRNFSFRSVVYKDSPVPFKAHSGFLDAWHDCRDIVMRYEFDRVVGYSHGAALALFAHEDCIYHGIPVDTFVFGCPRVFKKLPDSVLYRFVGVTRYTSKDDIVTKVPPEVFGFYHVGKEIVLSSNVERKDDTWFAYLSMHSPSVYRQRLAKL